jgi:hypothetical protein
MKRIEEEALVQRRLQTICDEAVFPDGTACKPINMMMRHLSNYYSVGRYNLTSRGVKQLNQVISNNAVEILRTCADEEEWNEKTDNEHPLPISVLFEQIRAERLSPDQIAQRFRSYPMVTVTKKEHRGLKHTLPPKERYEDARIERRRLSMKPIELLKIPDLAERVARFSRSPNHNNTACVVSWRAMKKASQNPAAGVLETR